MSESNQEVRFWSAELRQALVRWDPLGLIDMGAPDDEYDCMVAPILGRLEHENADEIVAWLEREFPEHFGLKGPPRGALRAFADDVATLYRADLLARTTVRGK